MKIAMLLIAIIAIVFLFCILIRKNGVLKHSVQLKVKLIDSDQTVLII